MLVSYMKNNRPIVLILIAFICFYWTVRAVMLFSGHYSIYAYLNPSATYSSITNRALIVLSIAVLFLVLGYFYGYSKSEKAMFVERTPEGIDFLVGFGITLMISIAFPVLIYAYLMFVSIYFFVNERKKILVILLMLITLLILLFISNDRRDYLSYILMIIFMFLYKEKLNLLKLFLSSFLSLSIIVYISIAMRSGDASFSILFDNFETFIGIIEVETDFSILFDDLVYMIEKLLSGKAEYLNGISFIKPLLYPIPREILPDKPETLSILYSKAFNPWFYEQGGSQPITIIGDVFWNFSYFGFVVLFFFGWFLGKADKTYVLFKSSKFSASIIGTLFCFIFSVLRGPFDNFIIIIFFILIIIPLIHRRRYFL